MAVWLTASLAQRKHIARALLLTLLFVACGVEHEATRDAQKTAAALSGGLQATGTASSDVVWVMMKDQADLSQARTIRDWGARGAAVRDALLTAASTKQEPLQRYLASRAVKYESFWIVNALRVRADADTIAALRSRPDVAEVSAERVYSIPTPQPSAAAASQAEALTWGLASIRAPEAWQGFGSHGEGIVVGSIDSGVQFDHPALVRQYRGSHAGSIDHNYNWIDPSRVCGNPSLAPCDNTAHGTHTMGTLVGLDENGQNQIGVAPGARWIAAKGCEDHTCTTYALLTAAQWMLAPTDLNGQKPRPELRPNIISNSWGSVPGDTYLEPLVQAWVAAGMFPVFAAGNSGPSCGTAYSPSDYPESYSVAAYDAQNTIALFSARGSGALGAAKPNIAAPGVAVRSSVPGNAYYAFDGTSMATPHVAGAVALLWSAVPSLLGDITATRALLDSTAVDSGDWNCGGDKTNNATWGEGRLDVYAALTKATPVARGVLAGKITDGRRPIANATVTAHAEGQPDHFILSGADGSYKLALPVGTYSVDVRAFGYFAQTGARATIAKDTTLPRDITLGASQRVTISGAIVDEHGAPVPFATVTALGVPLEPVTADVNGYYVLKGVPQGSYTLIIDGHGCYEQKRQSVTASSSALVVGVTLPKHHDVYGYSCQIVGEQHVTADQPLLTAGDDESRTVDLPFPFVYYGKEYKNVTVSINGALSFQAKPFVFANSSIPSPSPPNAAIYALWHNYVLDNASGVFTGVLGSAPRRLAVFEWRNVAVHPAENVAKRFNFALLLHETGEITLQYGANDALHYGELATIGIEDDAGADGLMYSLYNSSVVPGMSIRYAVPSSGIVRGTLTDQNDGLPLAGIEVAAVSGSELLRTTVTDKQGHYLLQLRAGNATIVANAAHYAKENHPIAVSAGRSVQLDLALKTATSKLFPAAVELIVPVGKSKTRELALGNAGSAPLAWTLEQSGGDAHTPGEVISSFKPPALIPWGLAATDTLWVSDFYTQANIELTQSGVFTGRAWPAEWPGIAADMAYDTLHKLMCQVDVGPGYRIGLPCWDPTTGKVEASISGDFAWTTALQRGLAYDASDDTFYIGGWDQGVIYHIRGLGHKTPGEILSQCQPPDRAISGLAWNASKRVLWMATNSPSDTVFQLDPSDCSVLSAVAHPAPGFNGAGLELDPRGELWMVAQNQAAVYLVASGVPTFAPAPWLSATPNTGTLAQGQTTKVTLTVNSAGLHPGSYDAALYLDSDAARTASVPLPVHFIVTDYQRAIDAGSSSDHIDGRLETWSADRAYVRGEWGYVGDSQATTSMRPIVDTDDSALYQTLRVNASGYRFDNVPNGVYAVELRFAQPLDVQGQHELDVIIEDEVVLPAYDPTYRSGSGHADDHTFFVPVTDGELDIRFAARVGQPIINALRVTHRPDR